MLGEALLQNVQVFAYELAGGQQQGSAAGASFLHLCCGPSL